MIPLRRAIPLLACIALACSSPPGPADAQDLVLPDAFPQLPDFDSPVGIERAPGPDDATWVVEQDGDIWRVEGFGPSATRTQFTDVKELVYHPASETGLLGLAFHPQFPDSQQVFLYYTAGPPLRCVLARFRFQGDTLEGAEISGREELLSMPQPYSNHNGGSIEFGPDGMLYVSVGDGGLYGDPEENGQDRSTLLGSILRIDVDATDPGLPYRVPPGNPFVGNDQGWRAEIWAWGLRNAWRIAFDPLDGGLWAGDVGQDRYEELDLIVAGGNYGWDILEASACYEPSSNCDSSGTIAPEWEYGRSFGASITLGGVYRGNDIPQLAGQVMGADFTSGRIWAYDPSTGQGGQIMNTGLFPSTFGVDEGNEWLIAGYQSGRIHRLQPADDTATPPARQGFLGLPRPNPGSGQVELPVELARAQELRVELVDLRGRVRAVVHDGPFRSGPATLAFAARDGAGNPLPAGTYILRARTADGRSGRAELVLLPPR